jgi:hypothetical protein
MVSGGLNTTPIAPTVFLVPTGTGRTSGAKCEIFVSGANIWFIGNDGSLNALSGAKFL